MYCRMASGPVLELRLRQLKKDVLHVLSKRPEGIEKGQIWSTVTSETGRKVSAAQYGVQKLSDVLNEWEEEIEHYQRGNKTFYRIRCDSTKPPSLNDKNDFPALDEMLGGAKALGQETRSKKPPKTEGAKAKDKDVMTGDMVIHIDVESDRESQKSLENNSMDLDKEDSILELEIKRTVIEVFGKLGPSNSATLVELWKLVVGQLGDIAQDKFKRLIERFSDVVEIFTAPGHSSEFEACRLKNHVATRLAQGETVNAILNKSSRLENGEISDNMENKNFEKEFGVFLRNMLEFFPNGCSVHVIMQNHELQTRFPMMQRMTPFEIHRLLSNTEGVLFDGTLCFLALSQELMRQVQITALRLISNGNFGAVMVPYLAEMIRRTDMSLSAINNMQVAQVLEATCVPNILFRNGEVYYRVQGVNLDQIVLDLVKGTTAMADRQQDVEDVSSEDEDDSDASVDEEEKNKQGKLGNMYTRPTLIFTGKKGHLDNKDIVPFRKGVYEALKGLPFGLKFNDLNRKIRVELKLKLDVSKKKVRRYCYDITERHGKGFKLINSVSLAQVSTIPPESLPPQPQKTETGAPIDNSADEDDESDSGKTSNKSSMRELSETEIATLRDAIIEELTQHQNKFGKGLRLAQLKKHLRARQLTVYRKQLHHYFLGELLQKQGPLYVLKPNDSSDDDEDSDSGKTNRKSSKPEWSKDEIEALRKAVIEELSQNQNMFGTGLRLIELKRLLRAHEIKFNKRQLNRYCGDIFQKNGGLYRLKPEMGQKRATAMELMSSLNTWGKPAGPKGGAKSGDPVIDLTSDTSDRGAKPKQVLKQDFISFDMDSPKTIDLTEESPARNQQLSQSYHGIGNMPARFPAPGPGQQLPLGAGHFTQGPRQQLPLGGGQFTQGQIPSLISLQRPMFSQGPVASQRPSFSIPMTAIDCTPARNLNSQGMSNNPFAERGADGRGPGFRDVVVDLTVQPIVKKEFERKEILAQPVYVPRGQRPSPDMVESIARECIEALADANEYVSPERIDKLLLQRFGVYHVRQLGFPYADKIGCINEVNRMINKINGYIYAFVKTRCICTLFELRECLREFVPNKEDFSKLKLGPLQRFPVVFEQFRFPPDQETIPEITSTDILEHFRNYLSKKNLWTSRLELEDFMNYLVETFGADNAYYLGVRIRSLPLAAQVGLT